MNIPSSKLEVNEVNDDLQVKDDDNTKKVKKTWSIQLCITSLTAFAH